VSRLARLLLSALGIGFLPGPAGTWASLATTAALVALHGPSPGPLDVGVLAAFAAGVLVTIGLAGRPARAGDADPSWVVSDEVAGQALAIAVAGSVPQGSAWRACA
jgi:phosphatidylglycerophosphatase A